MNKGKHAEGTAGSSSGCARAYRERKLRCVISVYICGRPRVKIFNIFRHLFAVGSTNFIFFLLYLRTSRGKEYGTLRLDSSGCGGIVHRQGSEGVFREDGDWCTWAASKAAAAVVTQLAQVLL